MTQKRKTSKTKPVQTTPEPMVPMSLDQIMLDLKGFGVEDLAEPISITASGKTVRLKLSNVPTEQELMTLVATEEFKGHAWIARVKGETLARSISWINGTDLRNSRDEIVVDPTTGLETTLQTALRNMIMGWGKEVVDVLWKVLMVHCQRIEDRLFESLPDSSVMTDVERRFIEQALQEIGEAQKEVYKDITTQILSEEKAE